MNRSFEGKQVSQWGSICPEPGFSNFRSLEIEGGILLEGILVEGILVEGIYKLKYEDRKWDFSGRDL